MGSLKLLGSRCKSMIDIFKVFVILELFMLLNSVNGHREHKVHNITLYPDKHSWCNVLPIKQVISHPGCKSVEIDNNVCVGACFSYSIPHTEPSDPGEVIVPYCDSCQPSEKKLIHINLECDASDSEKKSQLKVVQYITNCTCTSCEKDKYLEHILLGNSAKEIKELQNDTPDLLDALQNRDEINPKLFNLDPERSKLLKNLMNSQIMTLLKNIQSENSQKDKEQLTEALKIINEQSKEKVSDSTIAALVNSFYRENIELDLPKLLETLQALDNSKYFEKLRKNNNHEGSGFENNYNNDDDDNNNNNNDDISLGEGSRVGMGHLKGSHIGMGFNHYSHHHQNHHKRPHHEINYDTDNSNEDYDDRSDEFNEQHHHNEVPHNEVEVENIPNKLDLNENSLLHKLHHKIHTHHMHHKHHHGVSGTSIHHGDSSSSSSSSSLSSSSSSSSSSSGVGVGSSTDSATNEVDKPQSVSSSTVNNGGSLNKDEPIHIQVHPKHAHHHMHHHQQQQQQHGHHHLGENIGHGHLTNGPHGSLVIEPDHIEHLDSHQHSNGHERINVNPNDLKPNHAGTLLSYSSHPTSSNNS